MSENAIHYSRQMEAELTGDGGLRLESWAIYGVGFYLQHVFIFSLKTLNNALNTEPAAHTDSRLFLFGPATIEE